MLLAIDIGNSNISFGIFTGRKLKKKFDIPAKRYSCGKLKHGINGYKIDKAISCSVVPILTEKITSDLKTLKIEKIWITGKNISVPIKNLYRRPFQVGQDRLVNAYAAAVLYGAPLVIIDCGTAITFDAISKKKEYLGGMILPGVEMSLEALFEKTALLPKVKPAYAKGLIGKTTRESILSGVIYSAAVLSMFFSNEIKKKIGKTARVIGTGGSIGFISKYGAFDKVDKQLTLKGLSLIYDLTAI